MDRETASDEIKAPKDADDIEIEKFGGGFDNENDENRAENRPMTDKEKAALERWKQEDEELDAVIGDIDNAMDDLLAGIDEMGDNLKEQAELINKVEEQVDDLHENQKKTAAKLKNTLKNWKGAGSVATDVVMIIILVLLMGVCIVILKNLYF